MRRYESSPGVRTEAWSRGPFGDATAEVCTRTRYSRCACIPLPGRIPASGAPAPPYAGAPGRGSRLVWRRFRGFSDRQRYAINRCSIGILMCKNLPRI